MNFRKFIGLGGLLGLLLAGIWLVSGSSQLGVETSERQDAVRQLAASAGVTSAVADAGTFYAVAQEAVAPVMVNMSEVPSGIADPNNMYDRWLAGELDLDNEYLLTNGELAELRQLALSLPADTDIDILNEAIAGDTNLNLDVSFASLDFDTGGNGSVPPDPEITAGHDYIISVVNTSFEIYDKTGATVVPATSFSTFLTGSNCPGVFDPNVVYDQENNRYVMGIDANGARYCLAVSDGEDVTGDWAVYSFVTGNGASLFFDYPHLGVGQDALFMGGNIFNLNGPGAFVESRMWAFDKDAMYAGSTANFTTFGITDGDGTPYPLTLNGWHGDWPSTHYFATDPYDGNTLTIREWANPLGGGVPTILTSIDVAAETGVATGLPVDSPQNGGDDIQANDWRSRDFEYSNGSAWWTDSVSCNPGSGTVNCVRWVEIDMTTPTPTFVQGGVSASNDDYRIFPALAVNACGDMAVGYSKTNTSIFPSAYVAGREAGDAAGTLQDEVLLKAGEVVYTAFDSVPRRFGDYSGMAIDPNGYDFWYVGEYSKDLSGAARWGTYIGSFSFPGCQLTLESNMLYLPIITTP